MVEHTAVNRGVVGSSPTRGVLYVSQTHEAVCVRYMQQTQRWSASVYIRLLGQAVKTSPFHGGNTGSIPVGVTRNKILA